jgi:hypothetical protein
MIIWISFDFYKKIYFASYFEVFGYFTKCDDFSRSFRSILLAADCLGSSVPAAAIFISFSFSVSFPGARADSHAIVNSGLDFLSSAADVSC